MLLVSSAARMVDIFWPTFVEREGAIVPAFVTVSQSPPGEFPSVTEFERFHGHTHVQDVFKWRVPMEEDPELKTERPVASSPEHLEAWTLAQRLAEMWLAKLTRDYPSYRFRVYASRLDDPVVHFHRVRDHELPWCSDSDGAAQVARGDLLILDSGSARLAAR